MPFEAKVPIVIREININEIRTVLPLIREMNEKKYLQFERRINEKGDRCYVAWVNDQPAHFTWIRMHGVMSITSANRSYKVPDDAVWLFDGRTSEKFRGLGILPAMLSTLCALQFPAKKRVFTDTSSTNLASVKSVNKVGFSVAAKVYRLGIFSIGFPSRLS